MKLGLLMVVRLLHMPPVAQLLGTLSPLMSSCGMACEQKNMDIFI